MDYQAFKDKIIGKKVDFYHKFAPDSLDVVAQYIYDVHNLALPAPTSAREMWDNPPAELAASFFKIQENGTNPGDIVIYGDGIGIASGSSDNLTIQMLVQTDVVSLVNTDKSMVVGLIRHAQSQPLPAPTAPPEPSTMETLPKVYRPPTGGMKVPLQVQQKILIKVDLQTFQTPGLASKLEKPTDYILRRGMWEFDDLKYGMLKLKDTNYWINPAENVIKPDVPPPVVDTRHSYNWYTEALRYKADGDYVKANKYGEVFSFSKDKKNAQIGYRQPVWIAGTFVDGQRLYGIPANETDDGFRAMKDYGIPISYLSLDQMDYNPDEQISDVLPAEAVSMIPVRKVTVKDNITLIKAHGQKLIDGFTKGIK